MGMSTSIPPHNLGEVVDAVKAYIDNPADDGGGSDGVSSGTRLPHRRHHRQQKGSACHIYETGTGKIRLRGKVEVELGRRKADRDKLVITEIPYTMIGAGINKFLVGCGGAGGEPRSCRMWWISPTSPARKGSASSWSLKRTRMSIRITEYLI